MGKKSKPQIPDIYTSKKYPGIQMTTKGLVIDKEGFIKRWKGTANARGADLNAEWVAFRNWRNKYSY